MSRNKKSSAINYGQPSLFDDYDIFGQTQAAPDLPGLDHHIRAAQEQLASRRESTIKPLGDIKADRRVLFISFGSGSSGNSCYVGSRTEGILIDAGVDHKKIEAEMTRNGLSMSVVKGIILTHDHGDHVRYAYALLRTNRHMALYCTPRVLNGILRRHNVSRRIKDYHHAIYKEIPFKLGGFDITAFDVDHDGSDNMGFFITSPGFSFAVATDLGNIGERVDYYMRQATHIMIESNYDLNMLMRGHYPEYLKARIVADNGHLDNTVTANYLASIYRPELKYVFLCHLSNDNNTPDLATETVNNALAAIGITTGDGSNSPTASRAPLQVMALPRFDSTGIVTLRLP